MYIRKVSSRTLAVCWHAPLLASFLSPLLPRQQHGSMMNPRYSKWAKGRGEKRGQSRAKTMPETVYSLDVRLLFKSSLATLYPHLCPLINDLKICLFYRKEQIQEIR
jgi:hypothetical protein